VNRGRRVGVALTLALIACSTRATARPAPRPAVADRAIRVALPSVNRRAGGTTDFRWFAGDGIGFVARGRRGEQHVVEYDSTLRRVRVAGADGKPSPWHTGLVARVDGEGFLTYNGKRFRGELAFVPQDTGLVVVNRLGTEDYLRGVVPMEMGSRPRGDSSALQAQAVASRSYAYVREADGGGAFDVRGTTADQVYGGVDVENDAANAAVDATRGLVLRYNGRVVDAPFHSTCGGTTAEPSEIWRGQSSPAYLQRVSDRVGRSDRYYCDNAPRYRWSRSLTSSEMNAALDQYLKSYASVPGGRPGAAKAIGVGSRTPSGRVGVLEIETERGIFNVRGNDIRYVMRVPGGEMLPSTYFSVEPEYREGVLARVTLRGQGYGHGVGMCQWGAIGRARAGQSFRTILGTYYPGTTVGPVSSQ
jgi:stage II sporulation protein D